MPAGLNIVLAGPPGSGKSSQGVFLSKHFGLPHISTGALLRQALADGGEVPKGLRARIKSGALVPDDFVRQLLQARLARPDCARGFILDGFPRQGAQVKALDEMLSRRGQRLDLFCVIEVTDAEAARRICGRFACGDCDENYHLEFKKPAKPDECDACGGKDSFLRRADDTPEALARRLAAYKSEMAAIAPVYKGRKIFHAVSGDRDFTVIAKDITALMHEKLAAKARSVVKKTNRGPKRR